MEQNQKLQQRRPETIYEPLQKTLHVKETRTRETATRLMGEVVIISQEEKCEQSGLSIPTIREPLRRWRIGNQRADGRYS
jgi:hypothetical protein